MKIGVFDSGIGGLNVLKEVISKFPNNEYIYFGDTKNLPYGNKSKDDLLKLTSNIMDFLVNKMNVDIVIVACGTVSANCLDFFKDNYKVPIFDVFSPTIKYLKTNSFNKVGILATNKSIESGIFNFNNNILISCPKFVPLIEANKIESLEMDDAILEYLDNKNIDTLVLGCTHYPYIKNRISEVMNKKYNFIDMGKILVKDLDISNNDSYKLTFYFSFLNDNIIKVVNDNFKNFEIMEK